MLEELKKIVKSLSGTLVCASVCNEVLAMINRNDNLTEVFSLEKSKMFTKKSDRFRSITLKKAKKKFKNKLDYMIVDVNGVNINLNKVIYSTYKMIDKKIVFYGIYDEYDVDRIIKKYKRFKCNYNKTMYDKEFVLEISMVNINIKWLFIFKILDFFIDLYESIGNILMG